MAQDRTINALAIVAIIGGIFKRRMSKKLTIPTAIPDESATRMPKEINPFELCIAPIDSAPDSAITEGIERSILPGPLVITSICPSETSTVKVEKLSAVVNRGPRLGPPLPALNKVVVISTTPVATQALTA